VSKTILITGATDGLGRAVAGELAAQGHRLLLHGRDAGKLAEAARETGAVRTYQADLSELAQVHALADAVIGGESRLDVLVDNAGIGSGKPDLTTRQESADGHELRFAVNYLATYALTRRLQGLLVASAPARVVLVASIGQAPVDFDDVMLERDYSGSRAYSQSKLAQIAFGFELAERLDPARVTVNSLHPATYMPTKIVLEQAGHSIDTLETGVAATARLAVAPELDGVTGRFYDREREADPDPWARDRVARERLWKLSAQLCGLDP
jgi:NAD(P)-dependent dehydrogenase (short-subunit alcohol dehydrogenase family)